VGSDRLIVIPGQAAQEQGPAAIQSGSRPSAGPRIPLSRASSSTVIGVSVVGALLTAAAIAGVLMMGSASAPVATQVAAISAPSAVAQTSAVAPAMVPAPVGPALAAVAPPTDVAPALAPVADPAPAPPLNTPGQCKIGQLQQLAIYLYASERKEIGNVIHIHSGSYVSPPIVLTRSGQIVTFPAPPGSSDSARIIVEQSNTGGSTFDDEADGITAEFESTIDPHRDYVVLRWTTPRC
jgi:hypothetical protein